MKESFLHLILFVFSLGLWAQKGAIVSTSDFITDIEWSMHPRYVPMDFTSATNIVAGYNRGLHKYIDQYVNPTGFGVTLKAKTKSPSNLPGIISYKWEITGNGYELDTITRKACLFAGSATANDVGSDCETIRLFPSTGAYKIKITATSTNTKKVSIYEKVIHLKDYLIVAIGDSFTSGEGNPDVRGITDDEWFCDNIKFSNLVNEETGATYDMQKDAVWLEPLAHRSFYSPSSKIAQKIEDSDPHTTVTFLNFGTSGAKIYVGLLRAQHPEWQSMGQIDEAKQTIKNRSIDALIMSIGINDLGGGFGGISKLIGVAADPTPPEFFRSPQLQEAYRQIELLPGMYTNLNNEIKTKLNAASVFIYEIPINIFRNSENNVTEPCGALSYIDLEDAIIIDRIGVDLNLQEQIAAVKNGWTYLGGIVNAFKGHGYCETPAKSWYRAASTSCKIQGDINGTIHPNETGHQTIAEISYMTIQQKLQTVYVPTKPGTIKPAAKPSLIN
ncbi:MAG TPA: hypothetical protein PLU58_08905 [Saprospiraceae bacterium]|nr:hypothetical protein [Saprospiraceae bacterium]